MKNERRRLTGSIKSSLDQIDDRILAGITKLLAKSGGKNALSKAAMLSLIVAACSPDLSTPEPTAILPTPEPTPTVVFEPTPSPEVIENLESIVQTRLDEAFPTLGLHDTQMAGPGFLWDAESRRYAFFSTLLPSVEEQGTDLEFQLLTEVGEDYSIPWVKGLVVNPEASEGSVIEWLGISYNQELGIPLIEGPLLRTDTQTNLIEIFQDGKWSELNGSEDTIDTVVAELGGGVLAAPAFQLPTAETSPTPTEAPRPYEIVEGHREEIREEVLGVPVTIDIITDKSLQERRTTPVDQFYPNPNFVNPQYATAEGTMRAIYHTWVEDNPEAREGTTFEEYMLMVTEYVRGERPLDDVTYMVYANDLQTSEYRLENVSRDPTIHIKVVYLDYNITNNLSYWGPPSQRFGTQINKDGELEIWINYPADWETRTSHLATLLYVEALNRLSMPLNLQTLNLDPSSIGDISELDPTVFHPDVFLTLTRSIGFNSYSGAINLLPNNRGGR